MYIPAGSMAFDYNLSIDEISEHPLTAYNTVYLGMPKKDFALNFSILPDWTFYGSDGTTEKAERSVTQNGVTVIEGLSITTADGSPRGKVLAFENYFKTTNRKAARGYVCPSVGNDLFQYGKFSCQPEQQGNPLDTE